MVVNEFRYLTINDATDDYFGNWSRAYEYAYVLNEIKKISCVIKNPLIQNTCCGTGSMHMDFAARLEQLSSNVLHSDIVRNEGNKHLKNFIRYDILCDADHQFDVVLCISALEDIAVTSKETHKAFNNLLTQTKKGGRLIISCDYPSVSVEECESMMGQKIYDPTPHLNLHSMNSIFKEDNYFRDYRIILMDITK